MPPTTPKFADAIEGRHLGRVEPPAELRRAALPLRNFVDLAAFVPPTKVDYWTKAKSALAQMMGNDMQGDCVAVTIAKKAGIDTAEQPGGNVVVATTAEVLAWYHLVGGPADNGLYIPAALNYARDRGMRIGGQVRKIDGYVSVDNQDMQLAKIACYLFGGLHLGVNLPTQWYQHAEDTDVWDIADTRFVGGHSVPITGYDGDMWRLATWSRQPRMTMRAFADPRYVDECYAVLGHDWYTEKGIDVNGFNVQALRDALEAIRKGQQPVIPPDPNPPAPPAPPAPPVPVPGKMVLTGTVDFFGNKLPVTLTGDHAHAAGGGSRINWMLIMGDVAKLAADGFARDWLAVVTDVEKLLADLGITLGQEERGQLLERITTMMEAKDGEDPYPPQRRVVDEPKEE